MGLQSNCVLLVRQPELSTNLEDQENRRKEHIGRSDAWCLNNVVRVIVVPRLAATSLPQRWLSEPIELLRFSKQLWFVQTVFVTLSCVFRSSRFFLQTHVNPRIVFTFSFRSF